MNEKEHLLVCLGEECAEVQQVISKSLRFGLNNSYKDYGNNHARMQDELCDLLGVLDLLLERGILTLPDDIEVRIVAKKEKLTRFMEYAREQGALEASCG